MGLIEELKSVDRVKFSFGKADEYFEAFSQNINASCMFDMVHKLSIPVSLSDENKLWMVFKLINAEDGLFIFNINGVDLHKAKFGFGNGFTEASSNFCITEWELSILLNNHDYLQRTIFHNGKVKFTIYNEGINFLWN